MVEKVDPGPGYRLLKVGEVLLEGDEFPVHKCSAQYPIWVPTAWGMIGHRVRPTEDTYRRKIAVDTTKDTNPKDAIGVQKVPISPIPPRVLLEVGNALLEGAAKYGPFNWRDAGVRATIYYDATFRHLAQWYEGENIDADSGLHHVTKAIASLVVLRDAIMCGKMVDDRPPAPTKMSMAEFNEQTAALRRRYNPKGER